MRLLSLTGFYPPKGYGYGAICADVMEELAARGHDCTVLCVDGGSGRRVDVHTGLGYAPGAWRRPVAGLRAELVSQRLVAEALGSGIDAALAWHMRGVGKGALTMLHEAGVPVLYMLGDLWVVYEHPGPPGAWRLWQALGHIGPYRTARDLAGTLAGLGRVDLRAPPVEDEGIVCFASRWLRDRYSAAGFRPADGHVVPNGIRAGEFSGPRPQRRSDGLRVLYAGRIDRTKGADLAIAAIARVAGTSLVMAGGGDIPWARSLADRLGVLDRVNFAGELPRARVAELMREADVFVMPARIPDAFGLVYVEAMAAGCAVVGTAKGGAAEICRDGLNSIVVDEDAVAVAEALDRLRESPALMDRLRAEGEQSAKTFSLDRMVAEVESLLAARVASRS